LGAVPIQDGARMSDFDTYQAANKRLEALIDLHPDHDRSLIAVQARAVERLKRMREFLAYLGDPHRSAPIIHVAGTSGKGSTATAIASILDAADYGTFLHTSPYLQAATEKIQIGRQLISADLFADLVDEAIAAASRFSHDRLTYGEAWMAIVALCMARVKPDVAVIEVGAGGRFDLTNVVEPAVAVITTVGIDHTETLGDSIPAIAWHKAGIIKPGAVVVHSVSQPEARAEIDRQAAAAGVSGIHVVDARSLAVEHGPGGRVSWLDPESGQRLGSGIPGQPQAQNGAVAVAAARAFAPGIGIGEVAHGLAAARIAARFERMPGEGTVILDGAHNTQKMAALLPDLAELPQPRVAVIGFLAAKRSDEMIALLGPSIDQVVVASPDIAGKPGREVAHTARSVRAHVAVPVIEAVDPVAAVRMAETVAGEAGSVIVTGSLYLCGAARERWFPARAIVEQQTQWPEVAPRPSELS
jgi:dihydrofolate synthase/folylpolyglutamate synthase